MRFAKVAALTAAIGLLTAAAASAGRLILTPTGSSGFSTFGVKAEYAAAADGDGRVYWLNAGVSSFEAEWARFEDFGADNANVFSAQASVLPETTFIPAISVGCRNIGDEKVGTNGLYGGRSFYLAASKSIPITGGIPVLFQDVRIHGGIGTDSLSGVFFGIEGRLPIGLTLAAEYDTEDFNYQLSYNVIPTVKATVSSIKGDIYYGGLFQFSY